jgi:GTP-binding protein
MLRFADGKNLSVCDTPGIIENSHKGNGLGIEFLRHIERTKALIYVIDGNGVGAQSPINMLDMLQNEIGEYNKAILDKPFIIAINKMDKEEGSFNKKYEVITKNNQGAKILAISAKSCINLDKLTDMIRELKIK